MDRWVHVSLVAGLLVALPAPLSAQPSGPPEQAQPAPKKKRAPKPQPAQPQLDEEDQLAPSQLHEAPQAEPAKPARQAAPGRAVACSGPFGRDSSHLKLATVFGAQNIVFTEVDASENTKLMASVLYPKDPKRRLEVLWQNEAARAQTALIAIGGQSTWTAPKGLRLGMSIAALEKLNGKTFKLVGFNQPNGGTVTDWQGGSLEKVPGGCKIGIRLAPDRKARDADPSVATGVDLLSSDPQAHAARLIIAEILIGY
jgi:hypothetical protein